MSSNEALLEQSNQLLEEQNELLENLIKQGQANCKFQAIMADAMVVIADAVVDSDTGDTIMGVIQDGFNQIPEVFAEVLAEDAFQQVYDETVGDNIGNRDDLGVDSLHEDDHELNEIGSPSPVREL